MDPRRAIRRVLDGPTGMETAFQIVVFSYLMRAILITVITWSRPVGGPFLLGHVASCGLELGIFTIFGGLSHLLSRIFGGKGTLRDTMLAFAWFLFVTSPLTVIMMAALMAADPVTGLSAGTMALSAILSAVALWLYAAMLAEAHGFRHTLPVFAVVLCVPIGLSLVLSTMVPGP